MRQSHTVVKMEIAPTDRTTGDFDDDVAFIDDSWLGHLNCHRMSIGICP